MLDERMQDGYVALWTADDVVRACDHGCRSGKASSCISDQSRPESATSTRSFMTIPPRQRLGTRTESESVDASSSVPCRRTSIQQRPDGRVTRRDSWLLPVVVLAGGEQRPHLVGLQGAPAGSSEPRTGSRSDA
jgi:hypothetical protein